MRRARWARRKSPSALLGPESWPATWTLSQDSRAVPFHPFSTVAASPPTAEGPERDHCRLPRVHAEVTSGAGGPVAATPVPQEAAVSHRGPAAATVDRNRPVPEPEVPAPVAVGAGPHEPMAPELEPLQPRVLGSTVLGSKVRGPHGLGPPAAEPTALGSRTPGSRAADLEARGPPAPDVVISALARAIRERPVAGAGPRVPPPRPRPARPGSRSWRRAGPQIAGPETGPSVGPTTPPPTPIADG